MKYSITLFPERAQQTLKLLCEGKEKQEIITELDLSPNTYKKYLSDFRRHFRKKEVHAIVVLCLQLNLLE
jgi:DNA-binding NarL/FixJ family response regulator